LTVAQTTLHGVIDRHGVGSFSLSKDALAVSWGWLDDDEPRGAGEYLTASPSEGPRASVGLRRSVLTAAGGGDDGNIVDDERLFGEKDPHLIDPVGGKRRRCGLLRFIGGGGTSGGSGGMNIRRLLSAGGRWTGRQRPPLSGRGSRLCGLPWCRWAEAETERVISRLVSSEPADWSLAGKTVLLLSVSAPHSFFTLYRRENAQLLRLISETSGRTNVATGALTLSYRVGRCFRRGRRRGSWCRVGGAL